MLIDNFTVIAQLINFLILVWLLKRFLYQPVLRAIDAREARLQEQQYRAQEEQSQAQDLKSKLEQKQQELQQQRDELLEQARSEAREHKDKELEQARSEIEAQKEQWRKQLRLEQQQIQNQLRDCVLGELHAALSAALHDLADRELEQQMIHHFIKRLENLGAEQREELQHISTATEPVLKTSFALDEDTQKKLHTVMNNTLALDTLTFRNESDMTCGIKLEWEDHHLEWSLDTYLEQMQRGLQQQLEEIGAGGKKNIHDREQSHAHSSSTQQEIPA